MTPATGQDGRVAEVLLPARHPIPSDAPGRGRPIGELGGQNLEVRKMPRDGALTLSDVRQPTLSIVCEPCGRRGAYKGHRQLERTPGRRKAIFLKGEVRR